MGDDAAGPAPQRADDGHALEEVVGEAVDGPLQLGLDAVHDRGRIRRDGCGVVGDEQGAAVGGDLLQPLPLDAQPVLVHGLVGAAH
ncbi:hypothetical protein B7486_59465 [cyanobacterium TDX16]|nr:hypothetical protein B7486_59465 [cyanobacterium TDX16]